MSLPGPTTRAPCPFEKDDQLEASLDNEYPKLPGHPRLCIDNRDEVYKFLHQELWANDLESIWRRLWWMSKVDSGNISPLHRQVVKRRQIIVTEEPRLHLVWLQDRIFIKPLPAYLCSHAFWQQVLSVPYPDSAEADEIAKLREAALGFLRTYYYLVKHESDFRIAQDPSLCLIPSRVTWTQFCTFSESFGSIKDVDVSGRYRFGEIRLSRLNFYAPLVLRKTHYQRIFYQYSEYFGRYYAPLLFVFGFFSVILGCFQVVVSAGPSQDDMRLQEFLFCGSLLALFMVLMILLVLAVLWLWKVAREWKHAIRDWRSSEQVKQDCSGSMV